MWMNYGWSDILDWIWTIKKTLKYCTWGVSWHTWCLFLNLPLSVGNLLRAFGSRRGWAHSFESTFECVSIGTFLKAKKSLDSNQNHFIIKIANPNLQIKKNTHTNTSQMNKLHKTCKMNIIIIIWLHSNHEKKSIFWFKLRSKSEWEKWLFKKNLFHILIMKKIQFLVRSES